MSIINYLLDNKYINNDQLQNARESKSGSLGSILRILIQSQHLKESDYHQAISTATSFPLVDLDQEEIDPGASHSIPEKLLERYCIYPFQQEGEMALKVAMVDPFDLTALDELREVTTMSIVPHVAGWHQITKKISELGRKDHISDALTKAKEFAKNKTDWDDENLKAHQAILRVDRSPVVQLVDSTISEAIVEGASDIHIEPAKEYIGVRYRIDGVLNTVMKLPRNILKHLISRIKIMAELDISECRRPQDGRIHFQYKNRMVDLRISVVQTVYGEKVVLRLLGQAQHSVPLSEVGMNQKDLSVFENMIKQPQGMILVCGPTGSGKTTTLYTALNTINDKCRNIVTIEDPVEYTIEGINQIQINEKTGLTFTSCLRSVLRQDPDVILVGEIRDRDTAEIAFRSSLTGHLVFSTLHTNCSISAVTRLREVGMESFLIASPMIGIVAQRLLRTNCSYCSKSYHPPVSLMNKYGKLIDKYSKANFIKGEGCEECNLTGFKGRTAVFEMLPFDKTMREMVTQEEGEPAIFRYAKSIGLTTLIEEAIEKAVTGVTSLEEVEMNIGMRDDLKAECREMINDAELNEMINLKKEFAKNPEKVFEEVHAKLSDAGNSTTAPDIRFPINVKSDGLFKIKK